MADLMDIHSRAQAEMRKRYELKPVSLKHPFPERPLRALGLMKIDGEVFPWFENNAIHFFLNYFRAGNPQLVAFATHGFDQY